MRWRRDAREADLLFRDVCVCAVCRVVSHVTNDASNILVAMQLEPWLNTFSLDRSLRIDQQLSLAPPP